jgi:hypothetical protein
MMNLSFFLKNVSETLWKKKKKKKNVSLASYYEINSNILQVCRHNVSCHFLLFEYVYYVFIYLHNFFYKI